MRQTLQTSYFTDEAGNPAGGHTEATGLVITWQNGPLVDKHTGERLAPNGCFLETLLQAAVDRLRFYQRTKFECDANDEAIEHVTRALAALDRRTKEREERGVEGTHQA